MDSSSNSSSSSSDGQRQRQDQAPAVPPPMPAPRRQQQRRVIEEETPIYRSVMIARDVAPPMPQSFMSPTVKQAPLGGLRTTTTAPFKTGIASSSIMPAGSNTFLTQWKSCPPTPLPRFYPLERTHVRVEDVTAETITERICQTVKDLSLASCCNEDEDKNVLMVESLDGVKFAVQLFQAKQTTIIVEVQRTCGCCFGFRDLARAVLGSAQGTERTTTSASSSGASKRRPVPRSLPLRPQEVQTQCVEEDFTIAKSLLAGREDQQILGLDSLEQMTRHNNDTCKTLACKLVLSCDCVKLLVSFVDDEAPANATTDSNVTDNSSFLLKRKVLTVLANACSALSKTELCDILTDSESGDILASQPVVSMLLSTLENAEPKMNDAEQACRCLRALLISKDAERALVDLNAMDVVASAFAVGCSSHSGLEAESKKLLGQLRSVQ